MVELIRRVIPRDIVGGNVQKLRRMDALVHMFYEVAGTSGAFCTALALIPRFGNNMSFIITPPFFIAGKFDSMICLWILRPYTNTFTIQLPPAGSSSATLASPENRQTRTLHKKVR